jgi:hypothetical protein
MANPTNPTVGAIGPGALKPAEAKTPEIVSLEPEVIIQQLSAELLKHMRETDAFKRGTSEYQVAFPSGDTLTIKIKR